MVRISATDYLEHDPSLPQFTIDDAVKLSKILAGRGVNFIDVSGGGVDARQKINSVPGYQVQYAEAIKTALAGTGCLVGTVGEITSAKQAQAILDAGSADAIFVGRAFLKNPSLVWAWSDEMEVDIQLPSQCMCPPRFPFLESLPLTKPDGWGFGMTRTHRARRQK